MSKLSVEEMVDAELAPGGPRSSEYRLGMVDVLRYRLEGTRIPKRFELGTVQADAYYAGNERGHAYWRSLAPATSKGGANVSKSQNL
jgi:hypothetical protein